METKQVSPMCKTQRVRWPQTSLTSPFVFERVVLICTRTRFRNCSVMNMQMQCRKGSEPLAVLNINQGETIDY